MTMWVVTFCGLAVLVTIALFVSGALYPRPVVTRIQASHDAEMLRLTKASDAALAREREDCDYYRSAAQSCAAAVAHLDGQLRTLKALLEECQKG